MKNRGEQKHRWLKVGVKSSKKMSTIKFSPVVKFFHLVADIVHEIKINRLGRILTIVDACISDPEQRKGIKDLVENAYWSRHEQDDIKEVFRQFFQKYAQELIPKDDLSYWNDKGRERSKNQDYFPEE